MSNITSQNPIAYQIDTLTASGSGVLASNINSSINLTNAATVTGITVSGAEPSGTSRRFAFRVSGQWGRLNTSGNFAAFAQNNSEYANISENGNTAAELSALTNIPGIAGKMVGVAIALFADDPNNAVPTAALAFKCKNSSQQLTSTQYSPVYSLPDNAQIISLSAETSASDGGSVNVLAQVTLPDGSASGWKALESFAGTRAIAVQFRGDFKAVTLGVSTAQITSAQIIYSSGTSKVSGQMDGEIITQTMDWYMPIHNCRLTVNHKQLVNSKLDVYVAFREQPRTVKSETLGIGSGGRKVFQLAHTGGIKYDSFKLYFDNVRVFDVFELNSEVGRVTCEAPEGVIVSCDYDYGYDSEVWQKMTLSSRVAMDGYDKSEYRLTQASNNKSMAAVKIVLGMTSGRINNEIIGTGTGSARSYKLTHAINDGKISVTSNNNALSSKNWTLLDDPQYISVAAPAGQTIRASYDWLSETPVVYQFAAVFAQ